MQTSDCDFIENSCVKHNDAPECLVERKRREELYVKNMKEIINKIMNIKQNIEP